MTLVEIYCIGAVTQALYMAVKWAGHGKAGREKFFKELDEKAEREGMPWARKITPYIVVLMILIWPYTLIDRFILKREKK